jgi:hypothetical protein
LLTLGEWRNGSRTRFRIVSRIGLGSYAEIWR